MWEFPGDLRSTLPFRTSLPLSLCCAKCILPQKPGNWLTYDCICSPLSKPLIIDFMTNLIDEDVRLGNNNVVAQPISAGFACQVQINHYFSY